MFMVGNLGRGRVLDLLSRVYMACMGWEKGETRCTGICQNQELFKWSLIIKVYAGVVTMFFLDKRVGKQQHRLKWIFLFGIDNLIRKQRIIVNRCRVCKKDAVTVDHLLIHCPMTWELWSVLLMLVRTMCYFEECYGIFNHLVGC